MFKIVRSFVVLVLCSTCFTNGNALTDKVREYDKSRELDPLTSFDHSIWADGTTTFSYGINAFILIDTISYWEVKMKDGEVVDRIRRTHNVKALAYMSELREWPEDYEHKKINLLGYLHKEDRSMRGEVIHIPKESLKFVPYYPGTPYYFTSYYWQFAEEEHNKSVESNGRKSRVIRRGSKTFRRH